MNTIKITEIQSASDAASGHLEAIPSLVIYYHGAFVAHENGAHARITDCLRFACRISHHVTLYSYDNHPDWPWTPEAQMRFRLEFPNVRLVLDRRSMAMIAFSKLKVILIALIPSLASRLIRLSMPRATPNFTRIRGNILIVNYASGVLELNGIDRSTWLIDTHDIQFLNFARRSKKKFSAMKVSLKARSEIEIVSLSSATVAISVLEANLLRLLAPQTQVFFVASFEAENKIKRNNRNNFEFDLLFVGSQNPFNIEGICDFISHHENWLMKRKMAIVGRICYEPRVVAACRGFDGISLLGYIEDLSDLFGRCKAVISPVGGTGLKIKLLDAFRSGKPVFANAESMSALPKGYRYCAFPIVEEYMDAVLDNDAFRERAEVESSSYAERIGENSDLSSFVDFLVSKSEGHRAHKVTATVASHISRVQD